MLRYDLYSMQLLASVADTKSFAKTAAVVHLTPSAVSKRIAELEEKTGSHLVIRTPHGVEITDAGQAIVAATRDILARISSMSQAVAETACGEAGEISVVTNTSGLSLGLIDDLRQFRKEHPAVRIKIAERISCEVIDDVESGRADIGICASHVARRGLSAVDYHWSRLVVAVHARHPLAQRSSVHYHEITQFPQVGRPLGSMLPSDLPTADAAGTAGAEGIESSARSWDAVIEFVRADVGIAVLPAISVEGRPARDVVAIPLMDAWARFQLVACHDAALLNNPSAKLLLAWLARAAANQCPQASAALA
jgi:DNA-binding transcriptional LysR family regulator